jgi:hypothetical protein
MNPALLIFTQIAIAGCGFLVYFIYAMRRESKNSRKGPKVEIRPISAQSSRGNVVHLYTVERISGWRKLRSVSGR